MDYKLRIAGFEPESVVDGEGFRFVVFAQGCPHRCFGCHNLQSHAFGVGETVDVKDLFAQIRENLLLKGITLSGGEPFTQPKPLAALAKMAHGIGLDVMTYTGYVYERLVSMKVAGIHSLLEQTDLLVDGLFVMEQKNLTLRFRGSTNQRIIDMNQTRLHRKVVLGIK